MTNSEINSTPIMDISEIFSTHNAEIFKFVLARVRDREIALDITSDTFLKTYEFMEKNTIDSIRPFLYRVARNLVIDASRKKKSSSLDQLVDDYYFDASDTTHKQDKLELTMLTTVLDKLPAKQQDILTKRYINELTIEEIADLYGVSLNNAAVMCHRALDKAKKVFEEIQTQYLYV